jgi:hypothetical protein
MKNGLRVEHHGTQAPTAPADLPEPVTLGQAHLARTEPPPSDWPVFQPTPEQKDTAP